MSVVDVAVKTLKEAARTPRTTVLGLGLPVAFMLIFGLAFGGGNDTNPTYEIAYTNLDRGDASATYLTNLRNLTYDDGKPIVRLTEAVDGATARRGLEDRTYHAHLTLPSNFTAGMTPGVVVIPPATPLQQPTTRPTAPNGSEVTVEGDPSTPRFQGAYQVVLRYNQEFGARASGAEPVLTTNVGAVTSRELTSFDFIAPGLMVFAILNLAPQAGAALARETELRTIDRIKASPMRAVSFLAGVTLAQLVLAAIALVLMLVTAELMGFHNQGSYLVGYAIALAAAFTTIGIGLMVASFAKTQTDAANFGILISVPASFLSGAFFPVPGVDLFEAGGRTVSLYHLLPTTHAIDALRNVLTYGRGLDGIGWSLGALGILAVLYFAVGVGLFAKARLRPE